MLRCGAKLTTILAVVCMSVVAVSGSVDKVKADELIEKHLNAIGTKEARDAVKSITAAGKSKVVAKGRGGGMSEGLGVISSEAGKRLVGFNFDIPEYPGERVAFDGKDVRVNFMTPGKRSRFGDFILSHKKSFKFGVFGGTLTTGWELLNYDEKRGKLKCGKTGKVDGVKMHKCSYKPKKGGSLKISMYFHPETFHHIMTEYRARRSGGQGASINQSSQISEIKYKLIETFGDFKKVGDLTLPHSYGFVYERTGSQSGFEREWQMNLTTFNFNEDVTDSVFQVDKF